MQQPPLLLLPPLLATLRLHCFTSAPAALKLPLSTNTAYKLLLNNMLLLVS